MVSEVKSMLLDNRYKNDERPILSLNETQIKFIRQVQDKLLNGLYRMETVPCAVCGHETFTVLSEKDRYGFELKFSICDRCGLAQTNPRMTKESYYQFYDQEYRYIYGGSSGPTEGFFNDQYFRLGKKIYDFLSFHVGEDLVKGKFVLEVGCGAGGILKYFKDRDCVVKGIDLGSQYVAYGRDVHGLDLEVMPIESLHLEKKPDIIIYSHVLEHILDLKDQLSQIRSRMHSNTLLYIEVPGLRNLHNSYDSDLLQYLQNAHVYHFTKVSMENLMMSNGFQSVFIDQFVRSICRSCNSEGVDHSIINESYEVVTYLKRLEFMRRVLPIPFYRIKFQAKRALYKMLEFFRVVPKLSKKK